MLSVLLLFTALFMPGIAERVASDAGFEEYSTMYQGTSLVVYGDEGMSFAFQVKADDGKVFYTSGR